MATTIAFWNIFRSESSEAIHRKMRVASGLVSDWAVDVLMLAECPNSDTFGFQLEETLSAATGRQYREVTPSLGKVRFFGSVPSAHWTDVFSSHGNRLTIRGIRFREGELLIAAVHLPSRRSMSREAQSAVCYEVSRDIREREASRGHERTLAIGDFNMDPFDTGMVGSHGLHGAMTKGIARRGFREVVGRRYPLFYNPMWGRLGDQSIGPAGTHYYGGANGNPDAYFWHTFDQILIRPSLLPFFSDEFGVVEKVGGLSLLNANGTPDKLYSDHLPVYVRLNLSWE